MAISNPNLIDGIDLNGTNQGTPATSLVDDGYLFQSIPKSADMNRYFKELYRGMHFSKENGAWQYDAAVSYKKHARIMRDQNIYRSLSDGNQGNDPLSNPTFWQIDQWRMNTVTHNISADSDYTLTTDQNNFGKVIITDTGVVLTGAINIIMSDEEKDFIILNDTLQDLTIKTSAGTGILISPESKKWLLCDSIDIIESINLADTRLNDADEEFAGQNAGEKILKVNGDSIKNQCTAWVRFNSTNGVILDGLNISSVIRTALGQYTINFEGTMNDTNFAVVGTSYRNDTTNPGHIGEVAGRTTSLFKIVSEDSTAAESDFNEISVIVIGGLN